MLQSSGKRVAFTPPSGAGTRPTKRQERSSSPEEGELDDADPPRSSLVSPPHLPSASDTPPPTSRYSVKVKLPFKTKVNPTADLGADATLSNNFKGVPTPAISDYYTVPPERPLPDSWPSGLEASRSSRESRQAPSKGRKARTHNNELSHRDREFRDRHRDRSHSGSSQGSPVGDYDQVDRSKIRAKSRSRSSARSSSGSRSSSRKQTHRLPPHRTRRSPSPTLCRRRDGTPNSRDLRDRYNNHLHSRYYSAGNRHHDGRGLYWRDSQEKYYAGEYYDSPRPPYRDYYDRGRERDPYGSRYESTRDRAPANDYHPVSPRQSALVRRVLSPSPCPIRTPPQPRSPPPPTPPRSDLQASHPTTSFLPRKELPGPVDLPSLPSMSHPPSRSPSRRDESDVFLPEKNSSSTREESYNFQHPRQPSKPIRPSVRRTREEEYKAYGRIFVGSGQQDDYDAMTKLGEGTFGEVHKAKHRPTGKLVALKRILMHNEREGMPVTALREIKILKALEHPNVVELLDMFVVRGNGKDKPLSVYMVFPYMDHDLAGLLENDRVKLQPSQIKLYMKQLLEGTEYMHRNHILHRDMKAANLLISNNGSLRIADFGLARSYDPSTTTKDAIAMNLRSKERRYTNCVVTRWYRPPELLLGARNYGGEIDIWGVGCVLGEMFLRHPILPGNSDLDQLEKIWQMCGTPNQHTWPNFDTLPGCEGVRHHNQHPKRLKSVFEQFGAETCDLIDRLLTCNPGERITATQALEHDYFWTDPLPADPKTLPVYEASHEFDKRGRRQQPPQAPIGPPRLITEPLRLPPSLTNGMPYHTRTQSTRDNLCPPPSTRSVIPPPSGHQNSYPHPFDHRNGVLMNLPPIHYPAQGPPEPYQLPMPAALPHQISHLPPRPSMPMGLDRSAESRSRAGGRDNNQRTRVERDRTHGGFNS